MPPNISSVKNLYLQASSSNSDNTGILSIYSIPEIDTTKIKNFSIIDEDISGISAGKITSGTFDVARIPDISAGKITSGTFDAARIPNISGSTITSFSLALDRIIGPGNTNFETYLTALAARVAALEAGGGYIVTVVFNRTSGGGDMYLNLKTDGQRLANYTLYSSQNIFTVTLPGDNSYLYVNLYQIGDWYVAGEDFRGGSLGEPYKFYDNTDGVYWSRFNVTDKAGQTIYYDFSTYYNS